MTVYFDQAHADLARIQKATPTSAAAHLRDLEARVVAECAAGLAIHALLHPDLQARLQPFIDRFDALVLAQGIYCRSFLADAVYGAPPSNLAQLAQRLHSLIWELHTLFHDLCEAGLSADTPTVPLHTLVAQAEERRDRLVGARFGDPDLRRARQAIERGERPYEPEPS